MIWTYQWQHNADSSHSSEHYRLQLFVAVGFLPDDPSGIWRAGSNIVAAIKSYLGWRDLRWALLWSVPCEKGLCFGSLRTSLFQSDDSLEAWGSRDGLVEASGWCQGRERVGGKLQCSMFSVRAACLFRITLISLSFPIYSWVIARFLSTPHTWKESSLPVPGLHFHVFSCSSEKLWVLQPFPHPQILQDILIREMSLKAALLNPAHSSKSNQGFVFPPVSITNKQFPP